MRDEVLRQHRQQSFLLQVPEISAVNLQILQSERLFFVHFGEDANSFVVVTTLVVYQRNYRLHPTACEVMRWNFRLQHLQGFVELVVLEVEVSLTQFLKREEEAERKRKENE